jgi:hypothetical protein
MGVNRISQFPDWDRECPVPPEHDARSDHDGTTPQHRAQCKGQRCGEPSRSPVTMTRARRVALREEIVPVGGQDVAGDHFGDRGCDGPSGEGQLSPETTRGQLLVYRGNDAMYVPTRGTCGCRRGVARIAARRHRSGHGSSRTRSRGYGSKRPTVRTRSGGLPSTHSSAGVGSSGRVRNAGGAVRSSAPSGEVAPSRAAAGSEPRKGKLAWLRSRWWRTTEELRGRAARDAASPGARRRVRSPLV